jgi:hypothetical protein
MGHLFAHLDPPPLSDSRSSVSRLFREHQHLTWYVQDFFPRLHRRDPLLSYLGWILILAASACALLFLTDPVQLGGANVWVKPIKFNISFGTYTLTLGWWFGYLHGIGRTRKALRWSFFATISAEILCIVLQAARSAQGHNLTTSFDAAVALTTNLMIVVDTALVIWLLVIFWRGHYGLTPAFLWSIRLGILIFLAGNAIGGQMLAHHAHTVGRPDGGPGLPFLNWSTVAGDLRVAHFLSIHAIQVLPIAAFMLEQARPRWPQARQKMAVFAVAGVFTASVLFAYLEALVGKPLLRM